MKRLQLSNTLFLNKGRYRECYQHPENDKWVVKIQRLDAFSLQKEDSPHIRELRFYERLSNNTHFAKLIGAQQTNLGLGLIFEKIMNDDGSPAIKLEEFLLKEKTFPTDIYEQIISIIDQLNRDELLSCSAYPENLFILNKNSNHLVMSCDSKEINNKQVQNNLLLLKKAKIQRRNKRLKEFYFNWHQKFCSAQNQ